MGAPSTREEQFRKLFGYLSGFQGTWVAAIGRKAGLFRAIHEAASGVTSSALATRTRIMFLGET